MLSLIVAFRSEPKHLRRVLTTWPQALAFGGTTPFCSPLTHCLFYVSPPSGVFCFCCASSDAQTDDAPLEATEAKDETPNETHKQEEEQNDQAAETASGEASGAEESVQAEEDSGKEWGETQTNMETKPEQSAEKEEDVRSAEGETAMACGGEQPCESPPSEPLVECVP